MTDPSLNPVSPPTPPTPPSKKATDTARNALEVTGSDPASGAGGTGGTVKADRANAPHPPVGDPERIGGYLVVRKIGEGGMGSVYLAEDERLGRRVAVKTMKPELAANPADRERFIRESRAAANVKSDYIVPIWAAGEAEDGTPFLAMEFLEGEGLDARMRRELAVPIGLILKVAREVSDGLAAAHARGLIHRDIKPSNVWLEGDLTSEDIVQQIRRCKILDFGLARSVGKDDAHLTASGAILGTPAFMAPEQAKGQKVDARADLFSLGAMLYYMATGRLPFDGPTPMAVLISLTTESPPPVRTLAPSLVPELAELIDRMMSKDREERPQSAAEVAGTARQIIKSLQSRPQTPTVLTHAALQEATEEEDPSLEHEPASASNPRVLLEDMDGPPFATEDAEDADADRGLAPGPAPRKRFPIFLACTAALLALVALGLLANDLRRGKVENPDPVPPPPAVDADGAAARYVLSVGGAVGVNGGDGDIKTEAGLPREPFRLTRVFLRKSDRVIDAGLAAFKDCRHVTTLDLSGTKVGDSGVAHFARCADLTYLHLRDTRVTDAGLAAFKDCKRLVEIDLASTEVGDAGLDRLKGLTGLKFLYLKKTKVTREGVAAFARALPGCLIEWDGGAVGPGTGADPDRLAAEYVLTNGGSVRVDFKPASITKAADLPKEPFKLTGVTFNNPAISDKGLEVFKNCTSVEHLELGGTKIGNEGLKHFGGCKNLRHLDLGNTDVTDVSLPVIKGFANLQFLQLNGTKVTDKGVAELKQSLAKCQVQGTGVVTVAQKPDPDREAALWVLSVGGSVYVNETDREIRSKDALPKEPFLLTGISISDNERVTDEALAVFRECKNLVYVDFDEVPLTDAALRHFAGCKNLRELHLAGTDVTDASVEQLRQFEKLRTLHIDTTKVTARGVADIARALPLCTIDWDGGTIEAASHADRKAAQWVFSAGGTVHVDGDAEAIKAEKDLPKGPFRLTAVYLTAPVEEAKFAVFKDCRNLTAAYLVGSQITNAGLTNFRGCKNLTDLHLSGTKVDDGSVAFVAQFAKLTELAVGQTAISPKGVKDLAAALPKCRIQHNGGTVEPVTDFDRKAAEYVLSVGGKVRVNDAEVRDAAALPKDLFRLTWVDLRDTKVTDDGLTPFKNCVNLEHLDLGRTPVTDLGLAHFKNCKKLRLLDLSGTKVTDAGLANFKDCRHLESLSLADTGVTDAGLAHFRNRATLQSLKLSRTKVTDAGLAHFEGSKNLLAVWLTDTGVSEKGLAHLKDCKKLATLDLANANLTDEAAAAFQPFAELKELNLGGAKPGEKVVKEIARGLPACRIKWSGGTIEAATDADRKAAEFALAHGGPVRLNFDERYYFDAGKLPKGPFRLTEVTMEGIEDNINAGLAAFKGCANLQKLCIRKTTVTDEALAPFKDCKSLIHLDISENPNVGDGALAHFKGCENLQRLCIDETKVSDASVATIKQFTKLKQLHLGGSMITDSGVKEILKSLPNCKIETEEPKSP